MSDVRPGPGLRVIVGRLEKAVPRTQEPRGRRIEPDDGFLEEVEAATAQNLSACFQCRKCACGCPLEEDADVHPDALIRMIQLGLREEVLRSRLVWLCTGCGTCATRCPSGVDLAAVVDHLRGVTVAEGRRAAEPRVVGFHRAFLESVRRSGRSRELELVGRYKLATGTWLESLRLGARLARKGKLRLGGGRTRDIRSLREIMDRGRRGGRGEG